MPGQMRTTSTIQSGFATAATASRRPPPSKRRKLMSSAEAIEILPNQGIATQTVSEDTQTHVSKVIAAGGRPVCSTCHRAINARPEAVILCARCVSPTCPICSRTCTTPPPSQPPTPHLTNSPTPNPTPPLPPTSLPLPNSSPRRTALGLASLNVNNMALSGLLGVNSGGGRRRKFRDEEGNLDTGGECEGKADELSLKGCGRIFCRGCCEESWQSGSTTCLDCYERI